MGWTWWVDGEWEEVAGGRRRGRREEVLISRGWREGRVGERRRRACVIFCSFYGIRAPLPLPEPASLAISTRTLAVYVQPE